jgi:type VI secretion system secreted protein Hcp
MAGDMFMKIKGVEGESKDDKHKNEIDVLAWSWGATQAGSAAMGGGAGTGKVSVHDLNFTKPIDKASPDLFMKLCLGTHYDEAILTCRKAGGDNPLEFLKITMSGEVFVTGIQQGLSRGSEEGGTESVSLNFSKVKVEYTEQTEKGGEGAKPKAGFDIKANKKI